MTPDPVSAHTSTGRGGRRAGAGRKTKEEDQRTEDSRERLLKAKADREEANAARDLLKLEKEAGELYDRAEVLQLYTTTIAVFAEQARSVPDLLERKAGLSPAQAEAAAESIDQFLEDARSKLMESLNDAGA